MKNEKVALWLGYRFDATRPDDLQWESPTGELSGDAPSFNRYCHLWPAVYREIERRGLCMAYNLHLSDAVGARASVLWKADPEKRWPQWQIYALATATAAERLEALGKVMEDQS